MASLGQIVSADAQDRRTLAPEADSGIPLKGDFERMARRRFQNPKPKRRGNWWVIQVRRDEFHDGKATRKNRWERIAPATKSEREALRIAAEHLRPLNQGLEHVGSATNFAQYVENTYIPVALCTMAKSTQDRYRSVIDNYLIPSFGKLCLRDITPATVDRYFAGLSQSGLAWESVDKVRDVLASIFKRAIRHGLVYKNPTEGLELPRPKRERKPFLYPEQFEQLLATIAEPYASMVYVAIYTGLRVSELAGLRWNDIHADAITIDERYHRGDWAAPKTDASNATVPVNRSVIDRIQHLKFLTVEVKAGRATRKYRVVKKSGPDDVVFQSVKDGQPIRDNNILARHIKPAARERGLPFVNWQVLRRSFATWLEMTGANVKDAQGLMRHSRASTTLDVYQQFIPESQRRAADRLADVGELCKQLQANVQVAHA